MSRSYESNGPDVKIRGNAQHIAEKYIALARDATASGDRVMAENYLQHAEHYGRIVAAAQGTFQLQREEPDFEGEYDDEDGEAIQENGAPNGHPYPVPERAGGERPQPQPNQMQNNRDRDYTGNRDYNRDNQYRDGQNRDGQGNREQRFNRDDRNRDNQGRDNQGRDNQNRDGQNRDGQGREFQGRDRNRDFNRDRNRDNQNRSNNGEERRPWENRGERQNNWQDRNERQTPGGLGPQPMVGEMPAGDDYAETARPPRSERNERRHEEQPIDAVTANEPVAAQESGFGQVPAASEVLAEPEGSILPPEDGAAEPRRRTRQRRPRLNEASAANVDAGSEPAGEAPAVTEAPAAAPVVATESVTTEAVNDAQVAAKRPRGRPRKKKADDENADGENTHVPDFLLASNG